MFLFLTLTIFLISTTKEAAGQCVTCTPGDPCSYTEGGWDVTGVCQEDRASTTCPTYCAKPAAETCGQSDCDPTDPYACRTALGDATDYLCLDDGLHNKPCFMCTKVTADTTAPATTVAETTKVTSVVTNAPDPCASLPPTGCSNEKDPCFVRNAGTMDSGRGECAYFSDKKLCFVCNPVAETTAKPTDPPADTTKPAADTTQPAADTTKPAGCTDTCTPGKPCQYSGGWSTDTLVDGTCYLRLNGCASCGKTQEPATTKPGTTAAEATKVTGVVTDAPDPCANLPRTGCSNEKDPCFVRNAGTIDSGKGECAYFSDKKLCFVCNPVAETTAKPTNPATTATATKPVETKPASDTTAAATKPVETKPASDTTAAATKPVETRPASDTTAAATREATTEEPRDCESDYYPFKYARLRDCSDADKGGCKLVVSIEADVCHLNRYFGWFTLKRVIKGAIRGIVNDLDGTVKCDLSKVRAFGLDVQPILSNVDEADAELRAAFQPDTKDQCPDLDVYCGADRKSPQFEVVLDVGLHCGSCDELSKLKAALTKLIVAGELDSDFQTRCLEFSKEEDGICAQGFGSVVLVEEVTIALEDENDEPYEEETVIRFGSDAAHHVYYVGVMAVLAMFSFF